MSLKNKIKTKKKVRRYTYLSRGALNTTSMGAFKTSQLIFLFHTLFCHNPQV